jgi:hypothetical protein
MKAWSKRGNINHKNLIIFSIFAIVITFIIFNYYFSTKEGGGIYAEFFFQGIWIILLVIAIVGLIVRKIKSKPTPQ